MYTSDEERHVSSAGGCGDVGGDSVVGVDVEDPIEQMR
jgi:hypothetical protein